MNHTPLRICILSDAYENSASPLKPHDLPCDPRPYLAGHVCELFFLTKATAVRQVVELARQGFDVFINLCDGAWDEDRPGIEVVRALERTGQAFTGATSEFYEPSREAMKRVCAAYSIKTPAAVHARAAQGVARAHQTLRYPMIVKHPSSYSSIGLTRASRVTTEAALHEQARIMIDTFGSALIEEFIEGREFTVLVAENPDDPRCPTAYVPVEYRFPEGEMFKHFDMKWLAYDEMQPVPVRDACLAGTLQDIGRKLFVGLHGASYGRCDIRMDAQGALFLLEINPNCGVFYPPDAPGSADAILMNDPAGHRGFVRQIVQAAIARQVRSRRPWEVRADREGNYGMFAARPIGEGDLIEAYERAPHTLVTRRHVERCWQPHEQAWFSRYAYPLTDEVYVIWDRNPEAWKPLNHSCDPSAWLDGLNVVARRPIAPDEEITLDYATFCGSTMEAFSCTCGSAQCRGTITGNDFMTPIVEAYGAHVSDYVQKRREAQVPVIL